MSHEMISSRLRHPHKIQTKVARDQELSKESREVGDPPSILRDIRGGQARTNQKMGEPIPANGLNIAKTSFEGQKDHRSRSRSLVTKFMYNEEADDHGQLDGRLSVP